MVGLCIHGHIYSLVCRQDLSVWDSELRQRAQELYRRQSDVERRESLVGEREVALIRRERAVSSRELLVAEKERISKLKSMHIHVHIYE